MGALQSGTQGSTLRITFDVAIACNGAAKKDKEQSFLETIASTNPATRISLCIPIGSLNFDRFEPQLHSRISAV